VSELIWVSLATPVGQVWIGRSEAGVARVHIGSPPGASRAGDAFPAAAPAGAGPAGAQRPDPVLDAARTQLAGYFAGRRRVFDLPLDWSALTEPQQQVLGVLAGSVGYGQTVSYGALAQRAGLRPGNDIPARAVGKIMGSNPIPLIIPCHRVVASDGLGGYSGGTGPEVKRWLLILEGALPPTLDWSPAGP
jgi:methylated-DNA-[protein]-cysteine S-methyltransferase